MKLFLFVIFVLLKISSSTKQDEFWNIKDISRLKPKEFWYNDAQNALRIKLRQQPNKNIAKNVIFFLGDGMSVATATAGRIYAGQMKGIIGERNRLFFEKFPYVGLSKTYCVDRQVADSACTATSYLCGIKSNYETIGVTANVSLNDCKAALYAPNRVSSIASWAIAAGKSAGIVTNTRITHATPAGAYAQTASRNFESDFDVLAEKQNPLICTDIARQLIENDIPREFKVIFGGGLKKFLSNCTVDTFGNRGERLDGRDLISEWLQSKTGNAKFISTREQLLNTNMENMDYLLGLFGSDHLDYHLDKSPTQPRLEEMTEKAVEILQKNSNGYFLLVEGGRIDQAHHETKATKSLDETVQFAEAVKRAFKMTDPKETLIIVTADHSHTMTINGYPNIQNSIIGRSTEPSDMDGLLYSTLSYANGPAFEKFFQVNADDGKVKRADLSMIKDFGNKDFQYPAGVPSKDETHGGDDVAVYANGPWAHLFTGVMEQNSLASFMGFAACIGPGLHACQA